MAPLLRRLHKLSVLPRTAASIAEPVTTFPSPQFGTSIKYLAYGSNLSAETFLGNRGIKPLSQVNVVVPSVELMFDLPGIPYFEPRFANVRLRTDETKGRELIGVVYEVTKEDYTKILVSEGGYDELIVECFPLPSFKPSERAVPTSFNAQTLIIPAAGVRAAPGQPSLRYLTLLIHGAQEHDLPAEYQTYLASLHYYHTTTARQRIGGAILLAIFAPLFALTFLIRRLFSDKDGKAPRWVMALQMLIFGSAWKVYDGVWKKVWGDGEMTIGGGDSKERQVLEEGVRLLDSAENEDTTYGVMGATEASSLA